MVCIAGYLWYRRVRFACKSLVTGERDIYMERKRGSAESCLPGVRLARGSMEHTPKTSMGGEGRGGEGRGGVATGADR